MGRKGRKPVGRHQEEEARSSEAPDRKAWVGSRTRILRAAEAWMEGGGGTRELVEMGRKQTGQGLVTLVRNLDFISGSKRSLGVGVNQGGT